MTLHYLIISSVKEIIMNNYSFFSSCWRGWGVFDMIVLYIILKFFLKAVKLYGDAWNCTLFGRYGQFMFK